MLSRGAVQKTFSNRRHRRVENRIKVSLTGAQVKWKCFGTKLQLVNETRDSKTLKPTSEQILSLINREKETEKEENKKKTK
jgi:hypothetical protein